MDWQRVCVRKFVADAVEMIDDDDDDDD